MSEKPCVLLVEDDPAIAEVLRLACVDAGLELTVAPDLATARRHLDANGWHAVLLDWNLPDGTGIDLCRELRTSSTLPILLLTARRDEIDRVLGLELGADDYIVKPFSPREVVARVRAVLRRQRWAEHGPAPEESPGAVVVDERRREVRVEGQALSLTRTEYRLVRALARSPGRVFTRAELIERAWDTAHVQDRVVDSVVSRVRRKLGSTEEGEPRIRTVHGVGYAFAEG
jgi:DNA-binding response OmpR family regulator